MAQNEDLIDLELRKKRLVAEGDQLRRNLSLECEHLRFAGEWVERGVAASYQARRLLEMATPVLQLAGRGKLSSLKTICERGRNFFRSVTSFCD